MLKSKAMNKPAFTYKVIIIDEDHVKPIGNKYISNKTQITKIKKDKSKKGGLIINKKTINGKNKVLSGNRLKRI
jgi:hypothetical protein